MRVAILRLSFFRVCGVIVSRHKRTSLGCRGRSGEKGLWRKQSQSVAERSWTCILYGVGCVDKNALQAMLS